MASFGTPGAIRAVPPTAAHLGQGITYPLIATSAGRLAISFGGRSVEDSLRSIIETSRGERPMEPDYGTGEMAFEPTGIERTVHLIGQNIEIHEPRVAAYKILPRLGMNGDEEVTLTYRIVGEATPRTLTLPFFEGPAS